MIAAGNADLPEGFLDEENRRRDLWDRWSWLLVFITIFMLSFAVISFLLQRASIPFLAYKASLLALALYITSIVVLIISVFAFLLKTGTPSLRLLEASLAATGITYYSYTYSIIINRNISVTLLPIFTLLKNSMGHTVIALDIGQVALIFLALILYLDFFSKRKTSENREAF